MYQIRWLWEFLLALTLIVIHQIPPSSPQIVSSCCSNTTMFGNNSAYQTNLDTLFHSLSSNATNNPSGYYQTTVNNPTSEPIYGHYLCQGDLNTTSCHKCATTTDLPKTYCPNRKVAIIWYDECMVRYSNDSFFNKMDQAVITSFWNVNQIIGNATRFLAILDNMMNNEIAFQAPEGGPLKKFAIESANYSIFQNIYGLGQCTPDLTPSDCYVCLSSSLQKFNNVTQMGGRVLAPSCIVRFEVYPFFNLSYLPMSPQPSPSPSPSPSQSPTSIMPSSSSGKKKVSTKLFVSIIAALLIFSVLVFSICIYLLRKKARKDDAIIDVAQVSDHDQDFTADSLQCDLTTLLSATNNFSEENKLGEGGFGGVYKGTLSNGRLIAVKRLSKSSNQGIKEFKTEVLLVAKLQHRNLVRLLGFCYTGQEKLLVYEHVANKSLDKFLFDQENRRLLDWQSRYNIVRGIARGLLYFHHDTQLTIIHRDLKAINILLDEEMNPKISDFGTSRIFGVEQSKSIYTSKVVGTYGYMAPEYALHGQFSIKSDAYSFGVLVLEIISGRKNGTFDQPGVTEDLLSDAWKHWAAGTPLECVDPLIKESCTNNCEVIRCIQLGLLCIQELTDDRPTMANVVLTLDSNSVPLPIPQQPSFYSRIRSVEATISEEVGSHHSSGKSTPLSVNDDSITETEPR